MEPELRDIAPKRMYWILQWNCRGIKGKINELKTRIETWGDKSPDILLLQETRHANLKVRGYNTYLNRTVITNTSKQEKEGVAVLLIKETHPQSQINTDFACNEDEELVGATTTIGKKTYSFFSFYQKPGKGDEHYRWIKRIQNITQHKSIVGGDFNAEHSVWGNQDNRKGMNLLHQMHGNSFECLNKPGGNTRLGNKNQKDTTPDSSWTRGVPEVDWEAHDDTWGSDHVPIIITLHRKTREKRTARVTNWDKFREILKKKIQVEGPTDIEKHIKKAAQEATTTTQVDADAPNPDHHLTNLQEARHKALLRYRRKKTDTSRRIILNRATQEVTAYTRKLRKQTWIQHCEGFNDRTGVKKLWNTYRAMLGKKKEKNTGRNLALKLNMSEEELAQKLGETFFPQPDDWTPLLIEHTEERKEQDVKFSIEELNYAISRAKKGTAPGEDGVTPAMLKNLPDEGKHALLDHYNRIWEEHTLPQGWKHSTVIPIPKPNKPKDKMANLRPISLTSNICKTMERMVLERINWTLESRNSLHPMQTGFRKGLCTQDSLAMLHHDLTSRKVTKVPKFLVAVDIRKAFDSIPHKSVIASAKENGIEGNMLRFIQDFLEERTYKVKVGETEGLIQYNRIGVPQGAILSPTLFNITMTALAKKLEKIPNLSFTIYADDVTIWTKGGQTGKQVKAIKEALRAIDDFAEEVGLQVAPEKTALVIIATPEGRKATASKHKFTSAGRQLEPTSSTKILGMNISQDGKAKEWLEGLRKSWTHILGIIRRTATKSWGANENTLRTLIHAFLVSKAIYGYNYATLTKTQQEKIKCLMRKAQRVVTGLPNHARLEEVRKWALLNDIEDIAREGAVSQIIRLHGTKAGRVILTKLRKINLQMEEPEEPLPPWETSLPQEGKPPPNAGRETASTRHQNRIQALKDPNKEVIYTDATVTRENRAACAWYNITTEKTGRAILPEKTTVRDAEIEAIAKTIKDHQGNTERKYYIFSDSREAIQEYRSPATTLKTVQETSKYIDEAKKAGTSFTLEWVPGHAGIQGHDRAEREAKAALIHHYSTLSQLPAVDSIDSTDPYDYPPDIAKQVNKEKRKKRLEALRPIPPALPNMRLSRWQRVCLRRIISEAANTPETLHRKGIIKSSECTSCGFTGPAGLEHLIWDCPTWERARARHIKQNKIKDFRDWCQPVFNFEESDRNRGLVKSLLDFIATTGIRKFL